MGNRGRLHDKHGNVKWFQASKSWIICELEYKNIRRKLLSPNSYTELFFLDEATALAAGHRPCNTCRRAAAQNFLRLSGFQNLNALDKQLHQERMLNGPIINDLSFPNGTMIGWNFHAYLIYESRLYQWNFNGYSEVKSIEEDLESRRILQTIKQCETTFSFSSEPIRLCTPLTTVKILERDYLAQISIKYEGANSIVSPS